MSLFSELFGVGGGLKSVQGGYASGTAALGSTASGDQDSRYVDVTISAVDVAKAVPLVRGGWGASSSAAGLQSGSTASSVPFARLTSATNLRLSTPLGANNAYAIQWTVVEFS